MAQSISIAATGDSFITRRLLPDDPEVRRLAALIGRSDVRFTNLEVVVRRQDEGFPSAQSGGTWATTGPEALTDLRAYGFNLLTWANNHTLDYAHGGLTATAGHLDRAGWIHAGAGNDLIEAAAPRYLCCEKGMVACLGATSTFHESWIAGNPLGEVAGRPGVNPLRFETVYRVGADRLEALKSIAIATRINEAHELSAKEGFAPPDKESIHRFGGHLFREVLPGESEGVSTSPHEGDMKRLVAGIREARANAQLVLVSLHSHESKDGRKDLPADFLIAAARECIDAGADAVIGHGPHILRGVEIYRDRPIFYSLGNFIFQNESVAALPADFYEKHGLDPTLSTAEAFDARNGHGTRGLPLNPKIWSSVVACWTMRDGRLSDLVFHPISLGFGQPREQRGWPALSGDRSVLEELARLSRDFGTALTVRDDGTAVWDGAKTAGAGERQG